MDLTTARETIHCNTASFDEQVEAAAVISRSLESTFEDLLACLEYPGLPSEFAAMELYRRTGRPRETSAAEVVVSPKEWRAYVSKFVARGATAVGVQR